MATELRVYQVKQGKLDAWTRLFEAKVRPLRERHGFRIDGAWAVPERNEFVWVVTYPGDPGALRAADEAYYRLPEHEPLHVEALDYLSGSESTVVTPMPRGPSGPMPAFTQGPYESNFSEHDIAVFRDSGHGGTMGVGSRPALLVVDVNLHFAGDHPQPVLESIRRWKFSCGDVAWEAAEAIAAVLAAARSARLPIAFTTGSDDRFGIGPGRWAEKSSDAMSPEDLRRGHDILDVVAPVEGEVVIRKTKPSAFFGTPLAAWLIDKGADSVLVCGGTSSGCVRATVVDAFSHNYRVAIVAEATFDRARLSHEVSLFDLHQKYADVISVDDAVTLLEKLAAG